jgi:hypothetical protein
MSERREAFGLTVQRETSEEATGNIHQPPRLMAACPGTEVCPWTSGSVAVTRRTVVGGGNAVCGGEAEHIGQGRDTRQDAGSQQGAKSP